MKHVEFSEQTNRLRRNLMASAFLITAINLFGIKIENVRNFGIEFTGLTTHVVLACLAAFLLYHLLAYAIRAFEEYKLWRLTFTAKEASGFGNIVLVDVAYDMGQVGEIFQRVINNSGAISSNTHGNIISKADAELMVRAAAHAEKYGKAFDNFPKITRIRFWWWDIGFAIALAFVAIGFAISPLLGIYSFAIKWCAQ